MCITDLATRIFKDLGEPTDITIPVVAYWIQGNIGNFNSETFNSFSIDSSLVVTPDLGQAEFAILNLMYQRAYTRKQFNANTGSAGYSSIQEIKEGNRTVRKFNKTELAKILQQQIKDLTLELDKLILGYNLNREDPAQIMTANPIISEDLCGSCHLSHSDCRCHC